MTRSPSNDPPDDEGPDEDTVKAIVDASEARVFRIDPSMRMTWANRAARERHGLGQRATATLAEVFDAPKRAALLRPLRRALAGSRESIEWRSVDEQDRPCWTLATITPELDADGRVRSCVVVCVDATEQHRLSDARQRGDAQKRSVLENLPDLVWTMRADGSPDWFNHRWSEYGGRPTSEWTDLMPPEDQARARAAWEEAQRDPVPFTLEARLQRDDGALRWHLLRILPLRESVTDPTVWGWCGSGTDIDDRKKAEVALRSTQDRVGSFLGSLSHELRNPLAALAAAAHVLRAGGGNATSASAATGVVERQVRHMTRLVEDLLDVSRVTRGKISLARQPLDLAQAARNAVEAMRASGRLDEHQVSLQLAPAWVHADEARVEQIVANLVGNSVKYTPPGGSIAVIVRRERDTAILQVRDNGAGMTPELASRVFDLFVQGERQLDRPAGGLGIGLTLVKRLAELHGGTAHAASAGPGLGSVFTVALPTTEARAPAAQASPRPPEPRQRHRILVIEDSEDTRRTLSMALRMDGHEVFEAADGRAGVDAAASLAPEVALIDLGLPGLNGYQVAEQLRGMPQRDSMVLIALTGYGQSEAFRRAHDAGFDDHLTKPVAPAELSRLIDAACALKARRAAARPSA